MFNRCCWIPPVVVWKNTSATHTLKICGGKGFRCRPYLQLRNQIKPQAIQFDQFPGCHCLEILQYQAPLLSVRRGGLAPSSNFAVPGSTFSCNERRPGNILKFCSARLHSWRWNERRPGTATNTSYFKMAARRKIKHTKSRRQLCVSYQFSTAKTD